MEGDDLPDAAKLTEFEAKRHLDNLSDADYLRFLADFFDAENTHDYNYVRLRSIAGFVDAVMTGASEPILNPNKPVILPPDLTRRGVVLPFEVVRRDSGGTRK